MRVIPTLCLLLLFISSPSNAAPMADTAMAELDLECLQEAYPGFFVGQERDADGTIWFRTQNGARLLYDDGKPKTHEEALLSGDIEDSMRQVYPLEPRRPALANNEEAGRIRCYPLLHALYGLDRRAVEKGLVKTRLAKTTVKMTPRAAEAIQCINEGLPALYPDLKAYFATIYSQYWRTIAGMPILSAHSFGIAIDLTPSKGPYWKNSKLTAHPAQKTYPPAIVALFEQNGFVWGGKWQHFDLMHFEYRPEIIIKARRIEKNTGTEPQESLQ